MGPGPLWRRAPLRLLSEGPWAVLVVAALLLAATAAAADVLSVSAWRTASVQRVLDAVPEGAVARAGPVLRVSAAPGPGESLTSLRQEVDGIPGLTPSELLGASFTDELLGTQLVRYDGFVGAGDQRLRARLVAVDAPADVLVVTSPGAGGADPPGEGLWLPTDVAAELGVGVGDEVETGNEVSRGESTRTTTTVVGTYDTVPGGTRPADVPGSSFWAERAGRLPGDRSGFGDSALLVGPPQHVQQLATEIDDFVLWSLDSRLDPAVPTRTAFGATAGGVVRLERYLGEQVVQDDSGRLPTTAVSGIPGLRQAADDVTRRAAAEARTPAVGSIALGLALVLAVSALTAARRERELGLLAGLGVRPAAVGLLAVLEVLPAAVLGWALGLPLALAATQALAGVPPEPGAVVTAGLQAAVVVLAGVALHAVTSAVAAAAVARRGARDHRPRRAVPWQTVLVVAAVAATAGLLAAPVGQARGLDLSVPVLVAAAVGALGATALRLLAADRAPGRSRTVRPGRDHRRGGDGRLATRTAAATLLRRRLASGGAERMLVVTALATAFGLTAHVVAGGELVERAVQDKAAVLAGAELVVELDDAGQLDPDLPVEGYPRDIDVAAGDTAVFRDNGRLPGERPVDVVVVDLATFDAVASWGTETGPLRRSREALDLLAAADGAALPPCPSLPLGAAERLSAVIDAPTSDPPPPPCPPRPDPALGVPEGRVADGPAPVLVVGDPAGLRVGDRTRLLHPNGPVPLEVVGLVEAFPGLDPDLRTGLVAATGSYLPRLPGGDPRLPLGARSRDVEGVELWSTRSLPAVTADLRAGGVGPEVLEDERRVRSASEVLVRPTFVAVELVAPYLLALALLLLAVAVLALCLAVDRAAVRARAGDVVLARLGLGRTGTRRLLVVEAAVLVVAGLGLGALSWLLTAPLLPRLLEPEPGLGPVLRPQVVPEASVPLLAAAVVALLAAAVVVAAGGRSSTEEEVLRGQD